MEIAVILAVVGAMGFWLGYGCGYAYRSKLSERRRAMRGEQGQ